MQLGRGLSSALEAIHAAGVVHRDLKPANVLLLDADPVVIDFGIAHVADDVRLTMTGLVMGTPGYLAPELPNGSAVTAATDWWGWAATLAFAASGHTPFGRGPAEVVIDRVRRGEPDLSAVDAACGRCCARRCPPTPMRGPGAPEVLDRPERFALGGEATVALSTPRTPLAPSRPACPHPADPPVRRGTRCAAGTSRRQRHPCSAIRRAAMPRAAEATRTVAAGSASDDPLGIFRPPDW